MVGGGRGGDENFLYMAQYGCACRIVPFFSAAKYMISSLFSTKKHMTDPISVDWYMKGSTFQGIDSSK